MLLNYLDEAIRRQWTLPFESRDIFSLKTFGEYLVLQGMYRLYLSGGSPTGTPEHISSFSPESLLSRLGEYASQSHSVQDWVTLGEQVEQMKAEYERGQDAFEQTLKEIEQYPEEQVYLLREQDAGASFARGRMMSHYHLPTHPEQYWFINGYMNGERGWRQWRAMQHIEE